MLRWWVTIRRALCVWLLLLYALPCLTFACAAIAAPFGQTAVSVVFACDRIAFPLLISAMCLHLLWSLFAGSVRRDSALTDAEACALAAHAGQDDTCPDTDADA
jgi:hypothetical protein